MEVDIKPDGSERVKYNIAGLPLYVLRGILSTYPNYAAESHWHDDLEFIAVQSGKMQYNINGEIVNLHTGNGIFVNAKQFHFGFSDCHSECEFLCVLFHPALICLSQDMEKTFIAPIVGNTALSYCVLHGNIEWENRVLKRKKRLILPSNYASKGKMKSWQKDGKTVAKTVKKEAG